MVGWLLHFTFHYFIIKMSEKVKKLKEMKKRMDFGFDWKDL